MEETSLLIDVNSSGGQKHSSTAFTLLELCFLTELVAGADNARLSAKVKHRQCSKFVTT